MMQRTRILKIYLSLLLLVSVAMAVSAYRHPTAPAAVTGNPEELPTTLAGNWSGTWEDTIFSVSGEVTCTIIIDGSNYDASGTIDLSSLGLGVESGTASGTESGNTLDFTFAAVTVGDGSGALVDNHGTGLGTVTGALSYGAFTYDGWVAPDQIQGIFAFTTLGSGAGRVILTKVTPGEETSWGELKSHFDER